MATRRSAAVRRALVLAGLLATGLLLAGCAGSSPSSGDGASATDAKPSAESGILRGSLTAADPSSTTSLPVAKAGHGRLAATLVMVTNLPQSRLALNVSGPDGQSTEVDAAPILYVFEGQRPTVSFELPVTGEWTAVVRLDSGASADYEVHWCADDAASHGPQDNLACQRDY
jgi:hypothetical protein